MTITRRVFFKIAGVAALANGCAPPPADDPGLDADADGPDGAVDAVSVDNARPPDDARAVDDARMDAAAGPPDGASRDAGPPTADAADASPRDVAGPRDAPAPVDAPRCATALDGGAELEFGEIAGNPTDFSLGVMAGDALDDRAMVWTRYDGSRPLTLRVLEYDNAGRLVRLAYERSVSPTTAGFVHADVPGLRPGRRYRYAFLEETRGCFSGRSRVGRFRTAPDADTRSTVVFGGASCNHRSGAPFRPLLQAAEDDLEFFIHCGDHIYADDGENARTLAQYRAKYESYWRVPGLLAVHASTGLFTTWDDHEVENNWNAEAIIRTAEGRAQLAAATRTFFEHRAVRRSAADPDRIWRSFRWGRTAEIFMLDCRGERLPSTRSTPRAQFISPEQLAWLKAGLSASTAVFKFVVTSKPITGRSSTDLDRVDYWEGYPAQRESLLSYVDTRRIPGVWWLSGDVHYGAIARVEARGPYSDMREIYMGPAGSGDPGAVSCATEGQFDTVVRQLNYTRFRADPIARTLDVSFINGDGNVICTHRYPA